jgi:hypothetical protein
VSSKEAVDREKRNELMSSLQVRTYCAFTHYIECSDVRKRASTTAIRDNPLCSTVLNGH